MAEQRTITTIQYTHRDSNNARCTHSRSPHCRIDFCSHRRKSTYSLCLLDQYFPLRPTPHAPFGSARSCSCSRRLCGGCHSMVCVAELTSFGCRRRRHYNHLTCVKYSPPDSTSSSSFLTRELNNSSVNNNNSNPRREPYGHS